MNRDLMLAADQNGAYAPISENTQLQAFAAAFGLEKIPDDNDTLLSDGLADIEQGCASLMRAGVRFAILKERVGHGGFQEMLSKRGENARRAREAMQVVRMCLGLTPEQMEQAIASASPRKLIALVRLDPVIVREDADAGRLPDVLSRTVVDIDSYVRTRTKEHAAALVARMPDFPHASATTHPYADEPHSDTVARDELSVATLTAQIAVQRAKQIYDTLVWPIREADAVAETERMQLAQAIAPVLAATAETLAILIASVDARYGDELRIPTIPNHPALMPSTLDALRKEITAHADAEMTVRAQARAAAWKQRGAPPKTLASAIAGAQKYDASGAN